MPHDSALITDKAACARSRQTNKPRVIAGIDGRSSGARRLRDLESQLGARFGGLAGCDTAELAAVRAAALTAHRVEQVRAAAAAGRPVDDNELVRLANSLRRGVHELERLATAARWRRTGGMYPGLGLPVYDIPTKAEVDAHIAKHQNRERADAV
jgi:hypothetical protein